MIANTLYLTQRFWEDTQLVVLFLSPALSIFACLVPRFDCNKGLSTWIATIKGPFPWERFPSFHPRHQNCEHLQALAQYDADINLKTNLHFLGTIKKTRAQTLLRADLHGTIFVPCDKFTTGLHLVYDCRVRQKKCRSILKHFVKRCDNRKSGRRPVVSLSHAPKSHPVNRPKERVKTWKFASRFSISPPFIDEGRLKKLMRTFIPFTPTIKKFILLTTAIDFFVGTSREYGVTSGYTLNLRIPVYLPSQYLST